MDLEAKVKDLETKAKNAFIDDFFELAVKLYTDAIALNPPNCAELYADCAQANLKLLNFYEAVANANKAIEMEPTMAKAFLRKGLACMKLEEYETAKTALVSGAALESKDSRFAKLIKECDDLIAEEVLEEAQEMQVDLSDGAPKEVATATEVVPQETTVAKPKYRHEFYQKPEEVVVTIFAKGIPKDSVVVDFGEQILSVTIEKLAEEPYHFQPRLFGKIDPEKCRFKVLTTKIELRLAKADAVHWTSLEFSRDTTVVAKANIPSVTQRPTYPSSKPKRVDWDKLEAQVKKEEKEEKLDGDAAVNKFFRDIYGNADEDIRRAMTKSFVESNGTVLSTDWKDVGSKKVEGSPPDGMELKKYEY